MGLVAILVANPDVAAEPDHRPSDRFFFGIAGGLSTETMASDARAPTGVYETSFWPTDYVGISSVVAATGGDVVDGGGQLVLAVPLRWFQPYAGMMAGLRSTPDQIASRVHLIAGVNGYANRNLRAFVELRDPDVTIVGDDHVPSVVAGLRWSPDWFHRSRRVTKVDTVWWSTLLAAGIWTGVTFAR